VNQTKLQSAVETIVSTVVGFFVAICSQLLIFPFFGIHIELHQNFTMAAFFTAVSVLRGYIIRRYFNNLKFKRI
jgi:hypothetical protein